MLQNFGHLLFIIIKETPENWCSAPPLSFWVHNTAYQIRSLWIGSGRATSGDYQKTGALLLCLLVIFLDKTKSFLLISFLRLVFGKQTRFHYAYRSKWGQYLAVTVRWLTWVCMDEGAFYIFKIFFLKKLKLINIKTPYSSQLNETQIVEQSIWKIYR